MFAHIPVLCSLFLLRRLYGFPRVFSPVPLPTLTSPLAQCSRCFEFTSVPINDVNDRLFVGFSLVVVSSRMCEVHRSVLSQSRVRWKSPALTYADMQLVVCGDPTSTDIPEGGRRTGAAPRRPSEEDTPTFQTWKRGQRQR
ncbi:hypothetical protein FA15DRAFT_388850 [Coprinopsis marcescibilis]|uniref:Secreted protein n=1 Tax=Coprinopsis marcescibilis TaxID=230819 RepID=A0A5C3KA62_COPMA|nr:hypothetical protein FA15DRAFT_388850 [Coprinopsis marcescibilis]